MVLKNGSKAILLTKQSALQRMSVKAIKLLPQKATFSKMGILIKDYQYLKKYVRACFSNMC